VDRLLETLPFTTNYSPTEFWALRDVNLNVERGEILGVVGPTAAARARYCKSSAGFWSPRGTRDHAGKDRGRCWNWARDSIPNSAAARTFF